MCTVGDKSFAEVKKLSHRPVAKDTGYFVHIKAQQTSLSWLSIALFLIWGAKE